MEKLDMYIDSFKMKYESFLIGCDSIEEMGLWDKDTYGEMDAFYANDLTGVIIRLIAADGNITQREVDYLDETFDLKYTLDELVDFYTSCREYLGGNFYNDFEQGITYMRQINDRLADAYKDLLSLACDIIMESDGLIAESEISEVERIKSIFK